MSNRDAASPEPTSGTLPALIDSEGPTVPAPLESGVAPTVPPEPAPAEPLELEPEPGARLGRYEIAGRLGAGGMGVVFEARDTELDRTVALKVVRPRGGDLGTAHVRLRREAQAMARLSHPNVATVFDIGTVGGRLFIAMELVRGGTLRDLVGRRRPWRDELRTLIDAGRGLAAAHAAGVIHRDFKPDNVLVRADGTVRVADFGLAREAAGPHDAELAAAAAPLQTVGFAGTLAYMAPESFDGAADAATDQFAFAVTAFEVLEGHRPFERGLSAEAQLRALGEGRKPWGRRELPARVRAAIDRALALDPSARWPSMSALCDALAPRRPRTLAWALALLLAAAAAVGTAIAFRGSAPTTPPPTFNEAARQQLTFSGDASLSRLSPDGRWLAYAVGYRPRSVAVQDLKTGQSRVVYRDDQISSIQWSHDGARLLLRDDTGNLVIDRDGTPRARPPRGVAAWSPDGTRIVTTRPPAGEGLTFYDLATRKREHVKLALDATWVRGIDWSQLDRLAVLTKGHSDFKLWTVRPDGTELRTAATDAASSHIALVGWSADGRAILYHRVRDQVVELVRLEIEPRSGTSGRAAILLTTLPSDRDFSIAADGRSLVYVREGGSKNLARLSADGTHRALTADTRNKYALALSHDGRRIAYAAGAGERSRIFIAPSDGTGATPIPTVEADILDLDWSPAGTQIAYSVLRDGTPQLWTVDVATGETRRLAHSPMADHGDIAWASPGELVFSALGNEAYLALELATGRERELISRELTGWIFYAERSPDGRRIAVYVNGPSTHGVWSISLDGGGARRLYLETLMPIGWSEDGAWVHVQEGGTLTYAISASGSGEIRSLLALPRPASGKIRILPGEHEALAFEDTAQADVWRISLDGPPPSIAFAPPEPLPEPHVQPSLTNPDMALGAVGSPPPGWSPSPYEGTSVTTDRCLGASAPCASVSSGGWLEQRLVADPYRGKRIRLRVRTRVTGQSSLELQLQSPTRTVHLDTITATDTPDWHTLELIADVRPDARHLIINLRAAGSALFDDVSLEILGR